MLEIKCILSYLVRNFLIESPIPEQKLILSSETVLKSANGIKIILNKRNVITIS